MVDLARPPPRRFGRSPSGKSADPRSISHMSQSRPGYTDGARNVGRYGPHERVHHQVPEPRVHKGAKARFLDVGGLGEAKSNTV